jgi:hypothetical protein
MDLLYCSCDCKAIFDISIDRCLNSSLDILKMIFQIACCQENERECSLCMELFNKENLNL